MKFQAYRAKYKCFTYWENFELNQIKAGQIFVGIFMRCEQRKTLSKNVWEGTYIWLPLQLVESKCSHYSFNSSPNMLKCYAIFKYFCEETCTLN